MTPHTKSQTGPAIWLFFSAAILFSLPAQSERAVLQQDPEAAKLYSLAEREAQYRALSAMPQVDVTYRKYGLVRAIEGSTQIRLPGTLKLQPGDKAASLLQALKPVLLASGSESLTVRHAAREPYGTGYYLWTEQYIEGIPVIDASVKVVLDPNGEVIKVVSSFVPKGKATTRPSISSQVANDRVKEYLKAISKQGHSPVVVDEGTLQLGREATLALWTDGEQQETPILLWLVDSSFTSRGEPQGFSFGVDATTGEIRRSQKTAFGINRTVWSNQNNNFLTHPSVHLWNEGQPLTHALRHSVNADTQYSVRFKC